MGIISTTPLTQLKAVVIDCETTGLNVATDRIVQLAAIKIDGLKITKEVFNTLINPRIPIHNQITQIHKIGDQEVKDKPLFKYVQKKFHDFIQDRIIIGFNVGFDLAILRNEMERYQLIKKDYRHLDVRFLGNLLDIPSRELYLETLAYYFGISIEQRHSAMGDAEITAKIYQNIVPLLKKKNIQTLSQAEKYIFNNLGFINFSYSSDWYYPQPPTNKMSSFDKQKWEVIERIDPFPFMYNVSDIMKKNIISIGEEKTLQDAIDLMSQHNIGCLLITDKGNKYVSLISERDLVKLINRKQKNLNKPLCKLKKKKLITCHVHDFIYQALNLMEEKNIRHLPVQQTNKIAGILSYRDLMKRRVKNLNYTKLNINKIDNYKVLTDVFLQLPILAQKLLREDVPANKITAILSEECITITQKAIDFAIKQTKKKMASPVPSSFCILVLGSVGRGDTLLSFDQDNALIFEDTPNNQKNQEWFLTLGSYLNEYLNEIGIPFCPGNIMIKNPDWCMNLGQWKNRIKSWFTSGGKKAILNADIFLDFKPIYGNEKLFFSLKNVIKKSSKIEFIKLMGENIIEQTPYPLNFFGKIRTGKRNILDVKKNYLFPINSLARLLALKINYFDANSTNQRLQVAQKILNLNQYEIDVLTQIHLISAEILLNEQLKKLALGEKADSLIFIKNLNKLIQNELQKLLPIFNNITDLIHNYLLKDNSLTKQIK